MWQREIIIIIASSCERPACKHTSGTSDRQRLIGMHPKKLVLIPRNNKLGPYFRTIRELSPNRGALLGISTFVWRRDHRLQQHARGEKKALAESQPHNHTC